MPTPFSFCCVYFSHDLSSFLIGQFPGNETARAVVTVLCAVLCMVIPYLLGSLNFGIILSKLLYHEDIRSFGSGNAGSTNMLRTYGKKTAALTLACDMLKGALAVLIGGLLLNPAAGAKIDGIAIAALFVVLGHIFPCFYHFKGGKGVATIAMVILVTRPLIFVLLLAVFIVIVAGTRYVSLGSIISVMLFPVLLNRLDTDYPMGWYHFISVFMALLIVFMHRSNIKRLLAGKESKVSFGKKKGAEETKETHGK